MLPSKFRFIWPSSFRVDLKKLTNQKQGLPVAAMFLLDRDEMSKLYRGPSIDASYQVSVHLAKGFQRRRLKCEKLKDDGRQVMTKTHVFFDKVS
jgi:predicted aminopeptidase